MRVTYGYNVWIEALMLPYLLVLAIFLFFRYATTVEVNKRFRTLAISTLAAAALEVASTLLIDGWGHRQIMNLFIRTIYYAVVNINAFHLMNYVAAYVGFENKKLEFINGCLLLTSFVMLVLNVVPGISGFFFSISHEGGLYRGPLNTLCRSLYVFYFIATAFYLQLSHKQSYKEKSQFFVMNVLGLVLIIAFIVQYVFVREVLITYAVATVLIFIIFFYYEAPTYRQMAVIERELEEARLKAEQSTKITNAANRAKSDFLANTSHEIRTPMNAILGMNEMILNESKDKEIRMAALDIRKAGNHLLSIINNILDISKIESGKMEIYNLDYHLWQLLKDIEEALFESVNEKNLKLILDVDKTLPEHLHGDQDHLRQIIINLLDNAIKYTDKGSITLKVAGEREGRTRVKLQIIVKDTGIGIREPDLKRLFKSFERVNLNETQNIQGAGLGLTLVRYLLNLMGGSIHAASKYGEGTTFTVDLTQQLAKEGFQGTIQEYETMGVASTLEQSFDSSSGDAEEDYNGPFTCPEAEILIVDDTPVNLVVAKGMLSTTQVKIDTAESGEECLEKLKNKKYNIVFLDHRMPGMDGIETLNNAKKMAEKNEISSDIKYIALTANSGSGLREEYINYGFDDYLAKPLKSEAIRKILWRYLPADLKQRGGGGRRILSRRVIN